MSCVDVIMTVWAGVGVYSLFDVYRNNCNNVIAFKVNLFALYIWCVCGVCVCVFHTPRVIYYIILGYSDKAWVVDGNATPVHSIRMEGTPPIYYGFIFINAIQIRLPKLGGGLHKAVVTLKTKCVPEYMAWFWISLATCENIFRLY